MSQSGILRVADVILPPDVPTTFVGNTGSGSPVLNIFEIVGSGPISTNVVGNILTISSSGSGTVTSVSGTPNRITSTGGTTPVIDIAATYVGQTSITTLGTITTGVWNGSTITVPNGGTGQTTLTNHSVLVGAGTSAITQLTVGTSGQVLIGASAADPAFATLTSSDSSITFTTGANTLSLQVAGGATVIKTITGNSGGAEVPSAGNFNILGTGSITVAGTANTETIQLTGLTNHAIQIGAGTATLTQLSVGSTGQVLQANSAADPSFSTATYPSTATGTGTILRADGTNWVATTATYPATTTVSQILYSSATSVVSGLATANRAVLTTGTTGIPVLTALATDGQVIIGSTAGAPAAATLTAGTGITITNGSNTISIAANGSVVAQTLTGDSGGALSPTAGNFNVLGLSGSKTSGSGSTITIKSPPFSQIGGAGTSALNTGEFVTAAVTRTLPASAGLADGDLFMYVCTTAGALVIQSVTAQKIRLGSLISAAAGSATSTAIGDSLTLRFNATDGFFYAVSSIGNWTIA